MPKISDLPSVVSLDINDVAAFVSKDNSDISTTMKVKVSEVANKVVNNIEYGTLNTTDKKIIGAINEVNTKASQFDNMTATAIGSIATFSDGGDNIPVKSFECEIVAQQASGTPTPVSPLLITGFSQADIINGIPTTLLGIGYNINSSGKISTTQSDYAIIYIPVIQGEKYLINTNEATLVYAWYEEIPVLNSVSYDGQRIVDTVSSNTVTAPITGYLAFRYDSSSPDYGYVGIRVIVEFGQTIYGGRLIYANGQWSIEADKAMSLISGLSWNYDSANTRFSTSDLRGIVKNAESTSIPLEGLSCECYVNNVASSSRQIDLSVAVNTTGIMLLKDTNYTDVTSLLSAVGNYKIVYPLETPVIIPITSSTRVKTISGANNIFSNTGDCELEYFTNKADSLAELIKAFML